MTASRVQVRLRVHVYGLVQGVGFRPFVYRLAKELGLAGSVSNSAYGAFIEVEGSEDECATFLDRLKLCPTPAWIAEYDVSVLGPAGLERFEILDSDSAGPRTVSVLPDLATCPDCLSEMFEPGDCRYRYPFLNCTRCGPRFTIVEDIPYDRRNTTMRAFTMCAACRSEYDAPGDRRFHAQPTACPLCGPQLSGSIDAAVRALHDGAILALKGIGGFQLMVDARNESAVRKLRQRKHREQKPLAVMFPSVEWIRECCEVSEAEARILASPAAPIVLLAGNGEGVLAPSVAAGSPYIGAMVPYSPLHHLLLDAFDAPVVATSGNLADEPIAISNEEAVDRLSCVADYFLVHDRPIARHADDSVVRVIGDREAVLRRARGYAPLPVRVRGRLPRVLAVGAHLKSAVAIGWDNTVVLSQHLGDLDSPEARDAFARTIEDLRRLFDFEPELAVCDLHPDYYSTMFAETLDLPLFKVQHHHAHVAACAAENDIEGDYLGIAWDGTGYGIDGTIWGGEFFACTHSGFERIAHLRPFRLLGGERAIRDCRRSAASVLAESDISGGIAMGPLTTSAGRLFDAVASMTDIAHENAYEGQAAMLLEAAALSAGRTRLCYEVPLDGSQLDWRPMFTSIARDVGTCPAGEIAYAFHEALADAIAQVARQSGLARVVLSGGVFQNALLVNRIRSKIAVYTHWRVPPNDGGIALGQAVVAGSVCA